MATKNIVPRAANEGQLGTTEKPWANIIKGFARSPSIEIEFLQPAYYPLAGSAIASGTAGNLSATSTANHVGIVTFGSSASANSGYSVANIWTPASYLIAGGEAFECIFEVDTTINTTVRLGYSDSATATAPVDGVWINIAGTQLDGYAKNNSGPTITATHYDITDGVWYRAKLIVNADASKVTFTLVTCADGVQVWTDTVNANIPTGAGRHTVLNMMAFTTDAAVAKSLISLDYARYDFNRVLVR